MSGSNVNLTGDRLEHYVSRDPFDAQSIEALTPEQERFYLASQWQMMWWRLKRHHLAVVSGIILGVRKGKIRRLNDSFEPKTKARALRWDERSSRFVF